MAFKDFIVDEFKISLLLEDAAMSRGDIAAKLNVTKQNVGQFLSAATGKIYADFRKSFPEQSPFRIVLMISQVLAALSGKQTDLDALMNDFPTRIRKEIQDDAERLLPKKKK